MPRKLLSLATFGLLVVAPALAYAAPQAAVSLHARSTVSHDELAQNTAKGLATPVGIASASGEACELRCVLADGKAAADGSEHLLCELGEVRSVTRGFDVVATWSEAGATFEPSEPLDLGACH